MQAAIRSIRAILEVLDRQTRMVAGAKSKVSRPRGECPSLMFSMETKMKRRMSHLIIKGKDRTIRTMRRRT